MSKPYTVTRSTTINAPAEVVHALLADFHEWRHWSPWEDIDPDMRRVFEGAERGVGAKYAWEGNKKAGKGTMAITGLAADHVDVDLHFDKPFPADNAIVFGLQRTADRATEVTWTMNGRLNPMMRVFALVKSMDSLVGPDFEKGLRRLKQQAEARA